MINKEKLYKCHYCDNFAIDTIEIEFSKLLVCKIHDIRSLNKIEESLDNIFKEKKDF